MVILNQQKNKLETLDMVVQFQKMWHNLLKLEFI
jgi:hypothetical protein